MDCRAQLNSNFAQFKTKWGEEHAAGYRLEEGVRDQGTEVRKEEGIRDQGAGVSSPERDFSLTPEPWPLTSVSLCMIVRNEEANLPGCLESVGDLFGEKIIVDTGSTDRTKEIAAGFGARVVEFAWVDSFAAARNEALRHARGQWILWLDADDRLDEENRAKLRALFESLNDENAAYAMKCLCLPDPASGTATVVDHVRLFRNHPEIRWKYRVHEQILPAVRLAVCRAGRRHYPDDCQLLFEEGLALREHGDRVGAERCFLHLMENREGSHFASLDTGLRGYKARHNLAVLYYEQGRFAEAEAQWRTALAEQPNFKPALAGLEQLYVRHAIAS